MIERCHYIKFRTCLELDVTFLRPCPAWPTNRPQPRASPGHVLRGPGTEALDENWGSHWKPSYHLELLIWGFQKNFSSSDPCHTCFWHIFWHSFSHIVLASYLSGREEERTTLLVFLLLLVEVRQCPLKSGTRSFIWHIFWHSFWHSTWHTFWHSFWHICLAYLLTFFLAFYLAFIVTFYSIRHSIFRFIWHLFRQSFWDSIWHLFWRSIWHSVWQSLWHQPPELAMCRGLQSHSTAPELAVYRPTPQPPDLAVEIRQCPLWSQFEVRSCPLRSGAGSWGPKGGRKEEGRKEEGRKEGGKEGGKEEGKEGGREGRKE